MESRRRRPASNKVDRIAFSTNLNKHTPHNNLSGNGVFFHISE